MHKPVSRRFLLKWCGWFYLGLGGLFVLFALRYLAVAPIAGGFMPPFFRATMFVTQATLLVLVLLALTAPLVVLVPRQRVVVPVSVALATAVLAVVLVDTFVYQQYRFHLDASVWRLLTDGGADTTFHMPISTHLTFAGLVLGIAVLLSGWAYVSWRVSQRAPGRRIWIGICAVLGTVFVVHNGVHTWANAAGYSPITQQVGVLPLHKPLSAKRLMRKLGIEVAPSKFPAGSIASGLRYPRAPLQFTPPTKRENVCLFVVDSWRADALTPRATPNLARLAEESVSFTNHHSGGNATRMGMFSLFYGLPGTYWNDFLAEQRACVMIEEFEKQGYEIAVFRSAPIFSPELHQTIFSGVQGLRRESDGNGPAAYDRDLTDDFLAWLETRDTARPFFVLVFYDAPHAYDVPPDFPREFEPSWKQVDYLALNKDTDPVPFKNLYLNSVRWSDHQAGRVIDGMRAHGVIDDTYLVVTGDHGQEFNDLGFAYWGHNSNFARFQTQVPFLVRRTGLAPGTRSHVTSHYDVAATVLADVLGCTNPPEDFCVGRNLFDETDRGVLTIAAYSRYAAVRPGQRHVVVQGSGEIEVFGPDYKPEAWVDSDSEYLLQSFRQRARFRPGSADGAQ